MAKFSARLVLVALLVAACGGGQTPSPEPVPLVAVNATSAPLPPVTATSPPPPSSTPLPSPAPVIISPDAPDPIATDVEAPSSGAPALGDTWIRPVDGAVMVYVPGGSFAMGSAEDDPEALPEEFPQHEVMLDSYWIDETEVTNGQFVQFLNEHGNGGGRGTEMIVLDEGYVQIQQQVDQFVSKEASLNRPVVMVTWNGADAYCQWAGGRLPTEAEWEYAARGPESNRYPWGDTPPTCDLAVHGNCAAVPMKVGSRPEGASWCGVQDMAGNVWEWVSDWFEPFSDLAQENPTGPESGDVPVLRGGGWHSPRWEIRAAYRHHEAGKIEYNG